MTNFLFSYIVHFMNHIGGVLILNEELLTTWLKLSNTINNDRLVTGLSFNEAMVCGFIAKAQKENRFLTASDLCAETRILKSQMNAILRSLEEKGMLARQRSQQDLRQIELQLLPDGQERYMQTHQQVLSLVDRLMGDMPEEDIRTLISLLYQIIQNFDKTVKEA